VAIQRLEHELGCRLFDRGGTVSLTAMGRALRPYFVAINNCAARIEERTRKPHAG
jgi:DNA-binding transcriptional LysR family regulator